jgi:type I site-specific restriction endonuclease
MSALFVRRGKAFRQDIEKWQTSCAGTLNTNLDEFAKVYNEIDTALERRYRREVEDKTAKWRVLTFDRRYEEKIQWDLYSWHRTHFIMVRQLPGRFINRTAEDISEKCLEIGVTAELHMAALNWIKQLQERVFDPFNDTVVRTTKQYKDVRTLVSAVDAFKALNGHLDSTVEQLKIARIEEFLRYDGTLSQHHVEGKGLFSVFASLRRNV